MTPEAQAREIMDEYFCPEVDGAEIALEAAITAALAKQEREVAEWQEKAERFLHERDDALGDAWDRADVVPGSTHRDLEACLAKVPDLLAEKNQEIERLRGMLGRGITMWLRPATDADRPLFLLYRNDPESVRYSRNVSVTEAEHARWWTATSDHRWVMESDTGPVGTIRLSTTGAVSIVVDARSRGQGHGACALQLLLPEARELGYERVWGEVVPENTASQRAFLKAGWKPVLFEAHP